MSYTLFMAIPLLCMMCSVFLFLAVLYSKKTKLNVSFLMLLGCFVLWTLGSVLMRLGTYPGMKFWYFVSATGIFFVPYCIYNFIYYYTNQKCAFTKLVLLIIWVVIVIINLFDVFTYNERVAIVDNIATFQYDVTWLALIPLLLAVFTIGSAVRTVCRSIHSGSVPRSQFTPLFIGIIIMFFGLVVQMIFKLKWLSTDTIFCGINAVCIYYALYKKHIITLTPIASRAPLTFLAIVFNTIIWLFAYPSMEPLLDRVFSQYAGGKSLTMVLLLSCTLFLIYGVLRALMNRLFTRTNEIRERKLAELSRSVSNTLDERQILELFINFIKENSDVDAGYICTLDETGNKYRAAICTQDVKLLDFSIDKDNPLAKWLGENRQSITAKDFAKTKLYKSMWASEKEALQKLGAELYIPITAESGLYGIVLLTPKSKTGQFTIAEANFLESAASVAAIGMKNAVLYTEIENEARRDALTGLYNRSYFLRNIGEEFRLAKHDKFTLMIISLDDFRLFNELYGTTEGDTVLKIMADILQRVVGDKGTVARYSGKEFMVSLPFVSAGTAQNMAGECRTWLERYLASEADSVRKNLTFSAGICSYPVGASNGDELVSYTNMALYSAKKNGKNRVVIYSESDRSSSDAGTAAREKREISENCLSTIYALMAAIDAKDHYTFQHSLNVSKYASILAEAINLDPEHVEIIRQAGLLHDIGKIAIPEYILSKKSRLTTEEEKIMQSHVERSIAMIRHLPSLDYVIPAAIGHHERWDGKGYPRGISGENIPLGARCLSVADAFDAMTSSRPYRDALPVKVAVEEIEKGLGTQFDPVLGKKFVELVKAGKIKV